MPSQQQVVAPGSTTRWSPTPEQLTILEEMYRGGLRTPKSWQIQQITARLACYGRIERKNVFYWFQNHKARDRQKLRRRLCMTHFLLSYAAAAHHGHGHHHAGFLAVPPTAVAPYGHQLLSPSMSPFPDAAAAAAAAAASAAYGYYYPTTVSSVAAPPASRCAGDANTPSPTTQLFHHQGGEGGGLVSADALGRPEYSSLGKLVDNFGVTTDDVVVSSAAVDMTPPGFEVVSPAAFCRPLKTLDLFPGGLKEEQRDVA